jgi:hypothetical protein
MHTVEEITEHLTAEEKRRLIAICKRNSSIKARIKFIRQVLIGRLQLNIQGWDIMEYNIKLIVIANRLMNQKVKIQENT